MPTDKQYVITTLLEGGRTSEQRSRQKGDALKLARMSANNKRADVQEVTVDVVTRRRIHTAIPRRRRQREQKAG